MAIVSWVIFEPDLCRGVTFTFFHSVGIMFCWIVKLKMTNNGEARASDPSFSRQDGIPLTPELSSVLNL